MAFEESLSHISLPAAGDLSANQFLLHTVDTAGRAVLTAAAQTNQAIGVLQNKPDAIDKVAEIGYDGVSKVVCGETIVAGELLSPSGVVAGRVDDADAATDTIIGMALTGGLVGETISALIGGMFGGEVV